MVKPLLLDPCILPFGLRRRGGPVKSFAPLALLAPLAPLGQVGQVGPVGYRPPFSTQSPFERPRPLCPNSKPPPQTPVRRLSFAGSNFIQRRIQVSCSLQRGGASAGGFIGLLGSGWLRGSSLNRDPALVRLHSIPLLRLHDIPFLRHHDVPLLTRHSLLSLKGFGGNGWTTRAANTRPSQLGSLTARGPLASLVFGPKASRSFGSPK